MKTNLTEPNAIRSAEIHEAKVRYVSGGKLMVEPGQVWKGSGSKHRDNFSRDEQKLKYRCLIDDEVFEALPKNILQGNGCPTCRDHNNSQSWGKRQAPRATEVEKKKARDMRAKGLTYRAIGYALGRSKKAIQLWCDPEQAEKDRLRNVKRYQTHGDQNRAASRRYSQHTPHGKAKHSAAGAKYRGLMHDWYTNCPNDIKREQAIYLECERITRETGIEHHVDHIWPLSKGGPHLWYNLQIITAEENLSKQNTFRDEDKQLFASRLMELFNQT